MFPASVCGWYRARQHSVAKVGARLLGARSALILSKCHSAVDQSSRDVISQSRRLRTRPCPWEGRQPAPPASRIPSHAPYCEREAARILGMKRMERDGEAEKGGLPAEEHKTPQPRLEGNALPLR